MALFSVFNCFHTQCPNPIILKIRVPNGPEEELVTWAKAKEVFLLRLSQKVHNLKGDSQQLQRVSWALESYENPPSLFTSGDNDPNANLAFILCSVISCATFAMLLRHLPHDSEIMLLLSWEFFFFFFFFFLPEPGAHMDIVISLLLTVSNPNSFWPFFFLCFFFFFLAIHFLVIKVAPASNSLIVGIFPDSVNNTNSFTFSNSESHRDNPKSKSHL